jgi:hypothetical protein
MPREPLRTIFASMPRAAISAFSTALATFSAPSASAPESSGCRW